MAQLRKILLVDDDDDLREALSEQLVMTEDFDVFEAGPARTRWQDQGGALRPRDPDVGCPTPTGASSRGSCASRA
jgi:DNA-binding response OmpR family regulator